MLYPGQPEAEREIRSRRDGIVIDVAHFESLAGLAARFGISAPPAAPYRGGT